MECAPEDFREEEDAEVSCLMRVDRTSGWLRLFEHTEVTVGRGADVTYQLLSPSCPLMISRLHCTFKQQHDGQWTVTDRKSLNGVWLNRSRIAPETPHVIRPGDSIQLGVAVTGGDVEFHYVLAQRTLRDVQCFLERARTKAGHAFKKLKRKTPAETEPSTSSKAKLYRSSSGADKASAQPCPLLQTGTPQAGTLQTGTTQTETLQTGTPQTGTPQTGTPQTGTPQTGTPQTGTTQTETLQTETPQTQTGTPQTGTPLLQTGTPQAGTLQTGTTQTQAGTPQTGTPLLQAGTPQTETLQTETPQTQTGTPQTGTPLLQAGTPQTGTLQTGTPLMEMLQTGTPQTQTETLQTQTETPQTDTRQTETPQQRQSASESTSVKADAATPRDDLQILGIGCEQTPPYKRERFSQNLVLLKAQVDSTERQVASLEVQPRQSAPFREEQVWELQRQLETLRAKMDRMKSLEKTFNEAKRQLEEQKTQQEEERLKKRLEEALQEQKKVSDELCLSRRGFEEMLLAKNKELEVTKEEKEKARAQREEVVTQVTEVLENELQCIICSELFIEAVVLNCAHGFCCHCIQQWRKKKDECPICRRPIESQTRCLALDNCIDRMVENLSVELKTRRQELVCERKALVAPPTEVIVIPDEDGAVTTQTDDPVLVGSSPSSSVQSLDSESDQDYSQTSVDLESDQDQD